MTTTGQQLPHTIYERAAQVRPQRRAALIDHAVSPAAIVWLADGRCAYTTTHAGTPLHVLVDPAAGTRTDIDAQTFAALERWQPPVTRRATAPNGAFELVPRDHDLWLRHIATGAETRLTHDGEPEAVYGVDAQAGTGNTNSSDARPVIVRWSPDGRYALTQRTLVHGVKRTLLIDSAPADGGEPRLERYIQAFPGDAHVPLGELLIVDTATQRLYPADIPPLVQTHSPPLVRHDVWWDDASATIYVLHSSRDWLTLTLYAIDPASGAARELLREEDTTRVRPSQQFHQLPNVRILTDASGAASEIVWYSLRDGWGHLYLYQAATGELIRQLTIGECGVEEILHVDPATRRLWCAVSGLVAADPYRRTICVIDLDAGGLAPLNDDGLDHRTLVPPAAAEVGYLDWASTVDTPPLLTYRSWRGDLLLTLEQADLSRLEATGWQRPQRVSALAADGVTPIYGTLFLPPDFDPTQRYPVVDQVYPGPQVHRAEPFFQPDDAEPLAALGLIGVTLDGRGTPGRSRAFHNASWRNVGAAGGIEDHVAALRELAQTRPWLDISRVGVVGHSAGGFAVTRAMALFPEFFTVGVAQSGRHEGRLVMAMILEAYDGPPDVAAYARASAVESAGDITGRLLLIHGEMDRGVPLAHALRVVDRMLTAGRDVDLVVLPGDDHVYSKHLHYVERRTWDHLVRHLLQQEPPAGFRIP